MLTLFDVDVTNFPGDTPLRATVTFIGGLALLCGLLSMLRRLIRWTRVENRDRLLTIAIIMYVAAYESSSVAAPSGGGGYEFVGIVAMSAALTQRVARTAQPHVRPRRLLELLAGDRPHLRAGSRCARSPSTCAVASSARGTWNARSQWFDATKNDARFVIVGEGQGDGVTVAKVENYIGEPVAVYQADGISIMVFDLNLLTRVAAPITGPGD